MAFPLLGLLFAGGIGFKLHRRAASVDNFADQFEAIGYDENQARHLGRVATDQGVGAAMQMHTARRQYQLATDPAAAIRAHNADLSNPNVYVETPYGAMVSPRFGSEQWLADNQATEDQIQHRQNVLEYRDMIAGEGRWRGRNPNAATLDAMQTELKVGYAKALGGPVTESDLAVTEALFGQSAAGAILSGETNEELVAGLNQYLGTVDTDLGQQLNNVYWQDGHERDRKRYDALYSELNNEQEQLAAQARARAQDQLQQTQARIQGMRESAFEALTNQPGAVGTILQSLMLGAQTAGQNPRDLISEAITGVQDQQQQGIGGDIYDFLRAISPTAATERFLRDNLLQ